MIEIKEVIKNIEDGIKKLEHLLESPKGGYIIESDWHVHVGREFGLNGTEYAVKSINTCIQATIFETIKEAEDNMDLYLVDGQRKPILLKVSPVSDFFKREIENNKKLLVFIGNR